MVASWMVDGEALVVMAVMISSNSPSGRGPERRLLNPILGFGIVVAERNSFSSSLTIFRVFRLYGDFRPKEDSGGHTGWPHPSQARPRVGARLGQVWAPRGPSALFLLAPRVFWSKTTLYRFVS